MPIKAVESFQVIAEVREVDLRGVNESTELGTHAEGNAILGVTLRRRKNRF